MIDWQFLPETRVAPKLSYEYISQESRNPGLIIALTLSSHLIDLTISQESRNPGLISALTLSSHLNDLTISFS